MSQSQFILCFTWQCSYTSSFILCLSFNRFKHLECLCCFLFFHKNVYLHRVCLYDPIELNKHNFIIATIIISNIKKLLFSLNKVLLFQCSLLYLHCMHFLKIECIFLNTTFCCWCFQTYIFFYIEENKIFFRLTWT